MGFSKVPRQGRSGTAAVLEAVLLWHILQTAN